MKSTSIFAPRNRLQSAYEEDTPYDAARNRAELGVPAPGGEELPIAEFFQTEFISLSAISTGIHARLDLKQSLMYHRVYCYTEVKQGTSAGDWYLCGAVKLFKGGRQQIKLPACIGDDSYGGNLLKQSIVNSFINTTGIAHNLRVVFQDAGNWAQPETSLSPCTIACEADRVEYSIDDFSRTGGARPTGFKVILASFSSNRPW